MSKYKRIAPFGLYLSALAALAAIAFFIFQRAFTLPIQICLGLVVAGLALAVLLDPQKAREFLTGRQARYGSNIVISLIAFLGIVVALNILISKNTVRWDLTEDKEHTLAPETLEILASLKSPVQVNAFFTATYPSESTATLLDNFKFNSKGMLDFKFINPDTEPILAQQAGITRDGSLVISMGGLSEILTYPTEQSLASALIRLSNPGERVIYFVSGHGELDFLSSEDAGLSQVASALQEKNYTVKSLNLLSTPAIPPDALCLIIAGPNRNLAENEISLLKSYQDAGGSVVVWSKPKILTEIGQDEETLAAYISSNWGLQLGDDMIVDLNIDPPIIAYGASYGKHPITENISTTATLFPRARSLTPAGSPENVTLTPLVSTSENSWAETELNGLDNNQVSPDAEKDLIGPVTLAYAGENNISGARIVVVGNVEFASNAFYAQYGNLDLAVNIIDWAAAQENLLNLTSKQSTIRTLVTPTVTLRNILLLVSVIILPGSILITGFITWAHRKKRG